MIAGNNYGNDFKFADNLLLSVLFFVLSFGGYFRFCYGICGKNGEDASFEGGRIMKNLFGSVLGFGNPTDFVSGLIFILLGLIVLGDGQIGIQATPTSEVHWITAFAALPNWIGWLFIWFGFDSLFGGKLTKLLSNKMLTPIAKAVMGEERLKKLASKLESRKGN